MNREFPRPSGAPQVGAQLFVNRHDSPEFVERMVAQMAKARFSLLRVFLVWDHLEPREGVWQWKTYDAVFAAAARHGLGVIATLMAASPPGWMRLTSGLQDVADLDDPAVWSHCERYLEQVLARWSAAPALDSWILWNEPARILSRTPGTMAGFREFLASRYEGDIARLNRLSFRQYDSFDEVGREAGSACYELGFGSRVEQLDWIAFTVENLMEKLTRLAGHVRRHDEVHPIHVNPHRVSQCLLDAGQSLWREAELTDYMGFSAHPAWHSLRFPADRLQQSIAMFADLARSATRHPVGKFWCTELQGGPSVFTAFRPLFPSERDIRCWMWECAAAGASAVVFWCFNTREDGYEGGEWSLLHSDFTASSRLRAATEVAGEFAELAEWLEDAVAVPEVAILCSEDSQALGLVEGEGEEVKNPRNRQMGSDAVCGAYLMASDLGCEVAFVNEARLLEGLPPSVKLLLVPGCTVVDRRSLEAIRDWVAAGGVVMADALLGWKTPEAALARDNSSLLREIFDAEALDLVAPDEAFFSDESGERVAAWFYRLTLRLGEFAAIRASWPDGEPAVVEKALGQGRALRFGTVFFQRYLAEPEAAPLALFRQLAGASAEPADLRLGNGSSTLRLRRLKNSLGLLGVLINTGTAVRAEICFAIAGELQLPTEEWSLVQAGETRYVDLGAGDVLVLRFRKSLEVEPVSVTSELSSLS